MTILHAFILGIVEGITEFLPVSSTAHLLFASKLLHISQNEFTTFFEVFIQSGAILAVVAIYYQKLLKSKMLIRNILISFIPTAIVGLLLHKIIKTVFFQSTNLVLITFFAMGIVFIAIEMFIKKKHIKLERSLSAMTIYQAIIIGLFQSSAVLPGVSRAGAVIIGMMLLRFNRKESALYSFFLAVPTILAASALDLVKTNATVFSQNNTILLVSIGFVTSFITSLIVIKWFIGFVEKNTLTFFGVYRIVASVIFLPFL